MRTSESVVAQIAMMAMSGAMSVPIGVGKSLASRHAPYDCIEGVDIIEEYTLVKMKKSQLTFSQRQEVIRRYEHAKSRTDTE
jgi:hypothetical protein